ncbi:MAG: sugar phosphate isomerase/epimerase [Oscillospiraceae bacterium]|nr:sugar phosphate isomerase/epimerase [Oscillospiraceae bacterium]
MNFTFYTQFTDALFQFGHSGAAEYAKKLGYSSVELFSPGGPGYPDILPDHATAHTLHETLKKQEVPVACYTVPTDLWHNPNAEKLLMYKAELASELECPYLHHTLFMSYNIKEGDPSYEEARDRILESAAKVADHAKKHGVTCIYENQGGYFNSVEGFKGFFEPLKARCSNVGVCADLGNILFVGEEPQDFLKEFAADVKHVHIKDYRRVVSETAPSPFWHPGKNNEWMQDCMVGDGVIDFAACIKLLKEAGYNGGYGLELVHPEPFEDGVVKAMELLKGLE